MGITVLPGTDLKHLQHWSYYLRAGIPSLKKFRRFDILRQQYPCFSIHSIGIQNRGSKMRIAVISGQAAAPQGHRPEEKNASRKVEPGTGSHWVDRPGIRPIGVLLWFWWIGRNLVTASDSRPVSKFVSTTCIWHALLCRNVCEFHQQR